MRDLSKDSTQLYIKELTQTFLDNVVIESAQDVTRRWHRPTRREGGPLIKKDRPWEHLPYLTYSNYCALRDPQDDLFKCWLCRRQCARVARGIHMPEGPRPLAWMP